MTKARFVGSGEPTIPQNEEAQPMTWMEWYDNLAKPAWTPAPATISLIWMILYPIILISFGFVFLRTFRGKMRTTQSPLQ